MTACAAEIDALLRGAWAPIFQKQAGDPSAIKEFCAKYVRPWKMNASPPSASTFLWVSENAENLGLGVMGSATQPGLLLDLLVR